MKKHTIILIALLLSALCACSSNDLQGTINNTGKSDITGSITVSSPENDPDYIHPLHYNSVDELKNAISKENIEQLYAKYSAAELPAEIENELKENINKIQAQGVFVPCLNGKMVELRNKDGLPNILLFVSEAYGLPWVWYYPSVSTGENFYIKITQLPNSVSHGQNILTASDAIKELSPNSPNVGKLSEQHKDIYNQPLHLLDREVTALIYEYKTDNRNSMIFIYDELLIEIRCDPKVWSDQWFSALSFDSLKE